MNQFDYNINTIYSAGILPYTIVDNTPYFLLGRDTTDGTWSDFGGRCEPIDQGKAENTACREFYEETAGSVLDFRICKNQLKYNKSHIIISNTKNNWDYLMFLLRIPYVYYRKTFRRTITFLKYIKANKKYLEKEDIQWVSYQTILNSLNDDKITNQIILREVFKETIKKHLNSIDINKKNKEEGESIKLITN
jgi:hypothetical protein